MSNQSKLNNLALKAGAFYLMGQVFIRGLSFLTTILFTRWLTTEQFGIFKTYESWLLIMMPVVTLGLYRSVEVALYDYGERFPHYTGNTIRLGAILCVVFSALCIIFREPVCRWTGMTDWMLYIGLAYIFAEFSYMCFLRLEKQRMRYKQMISFTMTIFPAATFLALGWMYFGRLQGHPQDNMLFYRVAGYYVPFSLAGIILGICLGVKGNRTVLRDWKYGLAFSVPLIAELVSIQAMNQIDKIMIRNMVGAAEAGIYSLATTVSYIIWVIEDAVWSAWLPWLYAKLDANLGEEVKRPWFLIMHVFGLLSIAIVGLAPEIIAVLGGEKYRVAAYIVAPLTTATLFRFYSYSFSAMQNFEKKTKYVSLGTIITMFINVILNYFGIKYYGYIAAAYATAVSYFALMLIQAFFEKKVTGKRILPVGKSILVATAYFVICELFIFSYQMNPFLRVGCLFVILAIFFALNYKKLLSLVRILRKKTKGADHE